MPINDPRPDIRDVYTNPHGKTIIRDTHPHPAADGIPIGYILPNIDGDWAWTTELPTDALHVDTWNTADTFTEAAEQLLEERLVAWQDEYDRATEWEDYNRTHPIRRIA